MDLENCRRKLLGKVLNCYYHKGYDYLEVDVDIGSIAIATTILRLALGCIIIVTVDMGFLVEAQLDEELLEKLFGVTKICQMKMNYIRFVDNVMSSRKVLPLENESENEDE
ncbi:Protein of unknown function (DUF1336) [Abeliophyllum distichum]|uniref:Protein ENHANCED DISEASE RESISTANCE 2 C-terminal domain-containing protein n=1 Tax=Abeliophyllum distichum TaxID=126358 RepID=A0ABD1VVV8_9LAMI